MEYVTPTCEVSAVVVVVRVGSTLASSTNHTDETSAISIPLGGALPMQVNVAASPIANVPVMLGSVLNSENADIISFLGYQFVYYMVKLYLFYTIHIL